MLIISGRLAASWTTAMTVVFAHQLSTTADTLNVLSEQNQVILGHGVCNVFNKL